MNTLRHFLLAVQFFTRVPITGGLARWIGFSPDMQRASLGHLPGVGVLVGSVASGMFVLLMLYLPDVPAAPWVAVVVSTLCSVWMTGGLHEDGLADLSDGLGGSFDRDRALEIMKDSRLGSMGVMALVLALLLKSALLVALTQWDITIAAAAMWLAHCGSRLWPLWLVWRLPYVGDATRSKSQPLTGHIEMSSLVTAHVWTGLAFMAVAWLFPEENWLTAGLLSAAGAIAMAGLLKRRLQGFTGDALGATQQVCEILFYLGLTLTLTVPEI